MWRATYPLSGHLFVFRGRSGGLVKVIWHDGQGPACSRRSSSAVGSYGLRRPTARW
nr:transposase [Sinorhizobium saheli]